MKKNKGQMSIDMLLAIIIALLLISTIDIYTKILQQDTKQITEKNTARTILLKVYNAAANAKAYQQTIDLNVLQGSMIDKKTNCEIRFDKTSPNNHYIKIKFGKEDANYAGINLENIIIEAPKGTQRINTDIPCNEQITIKPET
jgi:uncharacterized protein (UPF0333 family)